MPPPFNIVETKPEGTDVINTFPTDEQANRAEIEEWLTFISDPATGIIRESVLPAPDNPFVAGTRWTFVQTAAPTGWTKVTTHNDKAMRIVNGTVGTGGSVAFETAFSSQALSGTISSTAAVGTLSGTALTTAQIPSHTHTFTTNSTGAHTHTVPNGNGDAAGRFGGQAAAGRSSGSTNTTGAHTHSGTTDSNGSGSTHTHTFTGTSHGHTFTGTAINLDVQFVDIIIATKD